MVVAVLLAALPFATWQLIQTGHFYVFSHRFVEDMIARLHGRPVACDLFFSPPSPQFLIFATE